MYQKWIKCQQLEKQEGSLWSDIESSMEEESVSLYKDLCLQAELQYSLYSIPELRQGEGFSFLNFLSSLPYPYNICIVCAASLFRKILRGLYGPVRRWFIGAFSWRISSHLLFSSAGHSTLSFLTNSGFWGKNKPFVDLPFSISRTGMLFKATVINWGRQD